MERVLGHECPYLEARDPAGRLRGVLPLVRVKSMVFGHFVVSMPFLNYGGPLGDPDGVRALAAAAADLARDTSADLLELRSGAELPVDLSVSHRKITVHLPIPRGDPESLWRSFDPKVRSQVRRPQKEGIEVRFGLDQVRPFFRVFSRHMRDLGTPTQSRALFEAVAEEFPMDVWFGVAYHAGESVAAGCGFRWEDRFEMTWASALRSHNRLAPNMLLYWRFLERCAHEAVGLFDFGRCTPGGGTHRFKRQWGGVDQPLWWYQSAHAGREATPSPHDGAYAWGPRLWRRLPIGLANVVGPRVVRFIP
jgi:serine/alanine adding enzyme